MTAPRRRDAALAALRRPEAALAALVLGACAFFYQAGGWNQNSRFAMVRALVEDGTNRIDRFAGTTGDLSRLDSLVAHADLLTSLRGDVRAYRK